MEDGPGIRTTVFLKGCQLRCVWCHNPESFTRTPQSIVLPNGATKTYGVEMTATEVFGIVERDVPFFRASGGGATISGGEPLVWPAFVESLVTLCHAAGIHTALETHGVVPRERLEKIAHLVDVFLFDYKAEPIDGYRRLTGRAAPELMGNLAMLHEAGRSVILRCPIVPKVNDDDDHLRSIARLAAMYPQMPIEVMPFHNTARDKWSALGYDYALASCDSMSRPAALEIGRRLVGFGVPESRLSIGGG